MKTAVRARVVYEAVNRAVNEAVGLAVAAAVDRVVFGNVALGIDVDDTVSVAVDEAVEAEGDFHEGG